MGAFINEQRLYEIASLQQGYFTARQAKKAGYRDSRFCYFVKKGKWIRERRGIYRLVNFPTSDRPDLVIWSLWSCDRKGNVQAIFSHQTALAIHDLSDIMPTKYHISVPKTFKKYRAIPRNIVLHFTNIKSNEVWDFEGYKVTSPEKTIHDILQKDEISDEIVIDAILDGIEKGLISKHLIKQYLKSNKNQRILKQIHYYEKNI